jgi:hypothetical protein
MVCGLRSAFLCLLDQYVTRCRWRFVCRAHDRSIMKGMGTDEDDLDLTADDLGDLLAEGEPVEVNTPRPIGCFCKHMTVLGPGVVSLSGICGCKMQPLFSNSTTTATTVRLSVTGA